MLLFLAQERGIKQGIYTSSMSVHERKRTWYPAEESVPLDSPSVYGLTKGFGELICQYFARWFDMNIIALRITGPRSRDQWLEERRMPPANPDGVRLYVTDEEDLAGAYLRALHATGIGHGRFDAVFIAGDEREEAHNLSKAKRLLDWQPQAQHRLGS
jgi:nucleoside-diphosphate-sugar epimerase